MKDETSEPTTPPDRVLLSQGQFITCGHPEMTGTIAVRNSVGSHGIQKYHFAKSNVEVSGAESIVRLITSIVPSMLAIW